MVVILDLGDGLTEAEQDQYDYLATTFENNANVVAIFRDSDEKPMPKGVIGWAVYDRDAASPRTWDNLAKFSISSPRYDLNECQTLDYIARSYPSEFVEQRMREELEEQGTSLAAIEQTNVDGATLWAYIDRKAVLQTVSTPTTPEEIEEFLTLDLEARGREILAGEIADYQTWATGQVYAVLVRNVRNGAEECLSGCFDTSADFTYLRDVAGDLAKGVTA